MNVDDLIGRLIEAAQELIDAGQEEEALPLLMMAHGLIEADEITAN